MGQIALGGSIGVPGNEAVLGNTNVIFTSDADHTLLASEWSNRFLDLTSSVSLTLQRNLICPIVQGLEFVIQNNTSGGQSIMVKGASGTGVSVPNGQAYLISCDGTNFLSPNAAASGGVVFMVGDVSGNSNSNTVTAIQGRRVSTVAPTNGQVLQYQTGSAQYVPVTISGSGVSWTGDLLGSADTVQYVTSISGNAGVVNLLAHEFEILDTVTSNFTLTQQQQGGSLTNGAPGYNILVTAQQGQNGGVGHTNGNGGEVIITGGLAGAGGGASGGAVGSVQISTADASSAINLNPGAAIIQANTSITNTMADDSASIAISEAEVNVATVSGTILIGNNYDGYLSYLQINDNYPATGDSLIQLNAAAASGKIAEVLLSANGVPQLNVSQSGITLTQLSGSGTGFVGINNSGVLSWSAIPAGVTWADDLAGSTSTNQYVASISGNAGAGGTIPINATTLQFGRAQTFATIFQQNPPVTSSTSGVSGNTLTIQAQAGQSALGALHNGGSGGLLQLLSGAGGTSGSASPGTAGSVIVGDAAEVNYLEINSGTGVINLQANASMYLDTLDASINMVQGTGMTLSDGYGIDLVCGAASIDFNSNGLDIGTGVYFQNVNVTSNYTADSGSVKDYYIMCSPGAAMMVTLPRAAGGRTFIIKDYGGNAGSNNITVSSVSYIDGAATYVINTNYGSVTLAGVQVSSEGTHYYWAIVGKV